MKVEFKVAMDKESREAGKTHDVQIEVDMASASRETLEKYALKAYKVELQSQIRPNWDKFIKGDYPKELKLGDAMFASTRGVVTVEKATDVLSRQLSKMSQEEKLAYLKECGLL